MLVMPSPLIVGGIKRWRCLTSVCLSRTSGLSREQRGLEDQNWHRGSPRHTWLGHHCQGQKVKVTRLLYSLPCWRVRRRWAWERVGREKLLLRCRLLGGGRRLGAHWGRRGAGAYRGGRPPTACYLYEHRNTADIAQATARSDFCRLSAPAFILLWRDIRISVSITTVPEGSPD